MWAVNTHSGAFFIGLLGTTPCARCFYCFLLLTLHKIPMKQMQLLLLPFYGAGNWGSEKFRDQPKFSWPVRDGARFGPRCLGFQSQRPVLAPEEGTRMHCWEDFKIFNFFSMWWPSFFWKGLQYKRATTKPNQTKSPVPLMGESSHCFLVDWSQLPWCVRD